MKLRRLLVLATSIALLAGCDRNSGEAQRLAQERAALEREKSELAAARAAADRAATDQERAKLDADRAALEAEKARLAGDKDALIEADRAAKIAAEREARLAAERRAADEKVKREATEMRESEARAAAEDAAEDAREAQSVDFFYDALDPYGDWVNVEGRGYCWHPRVLPGWRPYTDGGWVFTDYGWTWRSNEPFGWAVYHYGRWTRAPRLGWIWVPGTEWGPAWVAWRNSSDYVGWAPLPPDAWSASGFSASVDSYFNIGPGLYTFLRVADFGEPSYVSRVLSPAQNVTIINKTVNVTNVTYKTVQNKVSIVNNGPDLAAINAHSQRPVQRLKVERVSGSKPGASKVESNTLEIVAPRITDTKAATKPKQVKEEVKAAELDHGWADAKAEEPKIREAADRDARRVEETQRANAHVAAPIEEVKTPPKAKPDENSATPVPGKPVRAKPQPVAPAEPSNQPNRRPPGSPKDGRAEHPVPATPPAIAPSDPVVPPTPSVPERVRPQRPERPPPAAPPATTPATPIDPAVPGTPERVKPLRPNRPDRSAEPPSPQPPPPPADTPREPIAPPPQPHEIKNPQRPPAAAEKPKPVSPEDEQHEKKKGKRDSL